jgi:mono/diheme cytochrome c family protein
MRAMKQKLMRGAAVVALGASAGVWAAAPERPTFTKDILPILQGNCQTCHRPTGLNMSGMVAPMSLMTYEEVRPWAKSLANAVGTRKMPPWHASEAFYGTFRNERVLTHDEMQTIRTWVEQGAPRGNPSDAPAPMKFSETGWNLGTPDLIVAFPKPFLIEDQVDDLYHNVTTQLTAAQHGQDRWVKWVEFKAGSEVVHHIIGYAHPKGSGNADSGNEAVTRGMLGGNAPGTDTAAFPDGFGILLPAEANLTFAMHYHKEAGPGTAVLDNSQMAFKFQDAPASHPVEISTIQHGAFEIPPFANDWRVGASRTFNEDTLLLSMMPHMHLRGKSAKYTAYYPDGTSEVLLDVPNYDFNWQSFYEYPQPKLLPAGTRIEMDLVYDNSQENADRVGFDPAKPIHFGGPTTDEMDLAWITIAPKAPIAPAKGDAAGQAAGD